MNPFFMILYVRFEFRAELLLSMVITHEKPFNFNFQFLVRNVIHNILNVFTYYSMYFSL